MKVSAKLKNLRVAPRKTKLVADMIKNLDVTEALSQLDTTIKRTSNPMKKLLLSAIANAENNLGLDKDNLYVFEARVGAGPTMKRWMPKAFGRAGEILKRTSVITVVLEERVEGKGRKTKEQMEKEKKSRIEVKKREEKAATEKEDIGKEEKNVTKEKEGIIQEKEIERTKKETRKKTWGSRIFRRKSM